MSENKEPKPLGRPAYKPTARDRRNVSIWKAGGMANEAIAGVLKVSRNTLELHFAVELTEGANQRRAEVLAAQYKQARKGSTAAARLYLQRGDVATPINATAEDETPAPDLGKKAQADADAVTAHTDNRWGKVLQ